MKHNSFFNISTILFLSLHFSPNTYRQLSIVRRYLRSLLYLSKRYSSRHTSPFTTGHFGLVRHLSSYMVRLVCSVRGSSPRWHDKFLKSENQLYYNSINVIVLIQYTETLRDFSLYEFSLSYSSFIRLDDVNLLGNCFTLNEF